MVESGTQFMKHPVLWVFIFLIRTHGIIFSHFCLHGHFHSNLFSRTAELNYKRTMYSMSICSMSIWTFLQHFIFINFSFSRKSGK